MGDQFGWLQNVNACLWDWQRFSSIQGAGDAMLVKGGLSLALVIESLILTWTSWGWN